MQIILENNLKKLIPSEEKNWLLPITEIKREEEDRNYFKFAYLPESVTLEYCEEHFVELEREEEDE